MLVVTEGQIAFIVPGAAGGIVEPDPVELRAYLHIIGVKTSASIAENAFFWLLI